MGPVRHMATIEQTVGRVPATPERGAVLMKVAGLTKRYGDLDVLSDISFTVKRGEILGLIGRARGHGPRPTASSISTSMR